MPRPGINPPASMPQYVCLNLALGRPYPLVARRRREAPAFLVPDLDLICDETLSEEEEEEWEGGNSSWTQLKDRTAKQAFQEEHEEQHRIPATETNISARSDNRNATVEDDTAISFQAKKRCLPSALEDLEASGRELCHQTPRGDASGADTYMGPGRLFQCPPRSPGKRRTAVDTHSTQTIQEVGQHQHGDSTQHGNIRTATFAPIHDSHNTTSSQAALPTQAGHTMAPAEPQADAQQTQSPDVAGGDDFHKVPDVELSNANSTTDNSDEQAGSAYYNNNSTRPSWEADQVTGFSFLGRGDEEPQDSAVGSPDDPGLFEELGSPLGSEASSYVIYSNSSQSSNDDESGISEPARPLASCDVTDHVVPSVVIEE